MLLCDYSCKRHRCYIKSLFQGGSIVTAHLKNLGLVGADCDSVPHVPLETCEDNWVAILTRDIGCREFSSFVPVNFVYLHIVCLSVLTLILGGAFIQLKSGSQSEEVRFCV